MSSKQIQRKAGSDLSSSYSKFRSRAESHYAMDWASIMRFTAPTIGLLAALGALMALTLEAGCTSKPDLNAPAANITAAPAPDGPQASALQVSPPGASTPAYVAPAQPPAYAPPAAPDPVITQAPTLAASTGSDAGPSSGSSSYTVQHGDTLFRIAKQHYGDGKQWTRIASANPGLTPGNLKAGQKIVLP